MNTLTSDQFNQLLIARLNETQASIPVKLKLTWDFGDYAHFNKPRGYAVTFIENDKNIGKKSATSLHMRFSHKMLTVPYAKQDRVDAIIRHEIGHAVDAICTDAQIEALAKAYAPYCPRQSLFCSYVPSSTQAELRADAIAEYIWHTPMRYDEDEVQSLVRGKIGRPKHLGY